MKVFKKTQRQIEASKIIGSDAKFILLDGGSRSGKTFILTRAVFIRACKYDNSRHLALRHRFNHIKTSLWYDTIPKVLANGEFGDLSVRCKWYKSDWFIRLPNNSEIWIGGLDDKERTEKILGTEYSTIYFNECSEMTYESITTALTRLAQKIDGLNNKAYFDCNPPKKRHWVYKLFYQGVDPITNIEKNKNLYAKLKMNPVDNIDNLPDGYIEHVLGSLPDRQRKRFKDGIYLDDNENALWRQDWIDSNRLGEHVEYYKIIVAIDPAASVSESSDDTGIMVVAEGKPIQGMAHQDKPHYYVLEDLTISDTPEKWARMAIMGFDKWKADRIIAEKNNGGDMVRSVITNVDKNRNIPISLVWASRGKYIRAEPISALYEQGRVHHIGLHQQLEDQLTEWVPGDKSPDRLDALVWGISWLANVNVNVNAPSIDKQRKHQRSAVKDLPQM